MATAFSFSAEQFTLEMGAATIPVSASADVSIQGAQVSVTTSLALVLKSAAISEN